MISIGSLLLEVETEFRNLYWTIRASRCTNWQAVNKSRSLADILRRCGVPAHKVREGRYCLRQRVCNRCIDDADGLRCHAFAARIARGDY